MLRFLFFLFFYYIVYVCVSILFLLFQSDAFYFISFYLCLLFYVNVLLTNLLKQENDLNLFILIFVATKQFKYVKEYQCATKYWVNYQEIFINVIIIESIDCKLTVYF